MKKVINIFFIPFLLLFTACSADPVKEDLVQYINEDMKTAFELEVKAVSAYDSVSGIHYSDDWTMYNTIQTTVIPNYNEFIKELNRVKVETEELREIHEIYIEGADIQYNAFVKILTALETQDIALVEEANSMLEEARKLIRQYINELEKLAKEHEVEWDDSTVNESL